VGGRGNGAALSRSAGWGVRNIDGYNTEIMRRNLVKEYDDKGSRTNHFPTS